MKKLFKYFKIQVTSSVVLIEKDIFRISGEATESYVCGDDLTSIVVAKQFIKNISGGESNNKNT